MINYSQQLIDFLVLVKCGANNPNELSSVLLAEAQRLGCVMIHDNRISLTERGDVVSRMKVYYEKVPAFGVLHFMVTVVVFTVGMLSIIQLAKEDLIGLGTMFVLVFAFILATGYGWAAMSVKSTKRRVQVIEDWTDPSSYY
jgi:hypothetical protein